MSTTTVYTIFSTVLFNKRAIATSLPDLPASWKATYGLDHFRSACSCVVKSIPTPSASAVKTQTSVATVYATVSSVTTVYATTGVTYTLSSDVLVETTVSAIETQTLSVTATSSASTTTTATTDVTTTTTLPLVSTDVQMVTATVTSNVITTVTVFVTATTTDTVSSTQTDATTITSTIQTVQEVDSTTSITSTATTVDVSTTTVETTATATCTSSPVVNGGFDTGALAPWVKTPADDTHTDFSVVPGGYGGSPSKLYSANLYGNSVIELYQFVESCAGTRFVCTYNYYFTNYYNVGGNVPYVHIYVNDDKYARGVEFPWSAADTGVDNWRQGSFSFTSTGRDQIWFDCGSPQARKANGKAQPNNVALDNLVCTVAN